MLYIKTDCRRYEWHNDDRRPGLSGTEKVLEVQADGDELQYIREEFVSVPYPKHQSVVRWFGEMAAFIVHNL